MQVRSTTGRLVFWIFAWVAVDQLSKYFFKALLASGEQISMLQGSFVLLPAYNSGAFLSAGGAMPETVRKYFFMYGILAFLVGLFVWCVRAKKLKPLEIFAFASMIGGGLSNVIDRFCYDASVFDFLNLGVGNLRTGIFNIADVGIMAGVIILAVNSLVARRTQSAAQG
ncbi:MAG: signal peptidase II [Pseudomonas sp.]|uniref:signal peptidase II n=1 Tax=Pseudomonas abieticivorans TaxID=2931382 RepID=UPI0020BFCAC8|nr:signal peptidase II [Pseudomonas sp. PIA16]MDE1169569.1 signal peptidase II [Pseudomonas sp.]